MKRETAFHAWSAIAAVLPIVAMQFFWTDAEMAEAVPYRTLLNDLYQGKIAEVSVSDQYVYAHLKRPLADGKPEIVVARVDPALVDELANSGVTFPGFIKADFLPTYCSGSYRFCSFSDFGSSCCAALAWAEPAA